MDTEGSVNVSRRGGVCPPEQTTHNHSSGQADPAPTEGENKESASSAQSAPKKSCGLCHPEDTEGPVNVSCRGGVCPPEYTEQTHSLGQADPAPTVGESKEICKQHYRLHS